MVCGVRGEVQQEVRPFLAVKRILFLMLLRYHTGVHVYRSAASEQIDNTQVSAGVGFPGARRPRILLQRGDHCIDEIVVFGARHGILQHALYLCALVREEPAAVVDYRDSIDRLLSSYGIFRPVPRDPL